MSVLSAVLLTTSHGRADPLPPQSILRISAGEPGTNIYKRAQELADVFAGSATHAADDQQSRDLGVAMSSTCALSNLRDLTDGRAEFAIVNADIANSVYRNPGRWQLDQAFHRLRVVAEMETSLLHIVVPKRESTIPNMGSLRGARVSLSMQGNSSEPLLDEIFAAHGVPWAGLKHYQYPLALALRKLREGEIDALLLFDQGLNPIVRKLIAEGQHLLVPLNASVVSKLSTDQEDGILHLAQDLPYSELPEGFVGIAVTTYLLAQDNVSPSHVRPLVGYLARENHRISGTDDTPYRLSDLSSIIPVHDALANPAAGGEATPRERLIDGDLVDLYGVEP